MNRLWAVLALVLAACAHDPEPVKPAPDYDAVRQRAHDSHESLKQQEGQAPQN